MKRLNPKRLTKKQVQDLIASGATLRQDLADKLSGTSNTQNQPSIYELPHDRFLLVLDPLGGRQCGTGDIYAGEQFRRLLDWTQRVYEDSAQGRFGSVAHWQFYSHYKVRLIGALEPLIAELATGLELDPKKLDMSYSSLIAVSTEIAKMGVRNVQEFFYDGLVAYVGEVLRAKAGGEWKINSLECEPYPYIFSESHGVLMPVNIVWNDLSGLDQVDLRKAVLNALRRAKRIHNFGKVQG